MYVFVSHVVEEGITEIPFEFLLKPLEGQGIVVFFFFGLKLITRVA
jgi:hypothetical protein